MSINFDLIQSFSSAKELDEFVASLIIEDFKKPGLVLLPVGNTFESGIYPLVNEYFKYSEYELREMESQDQVFKDSIHLVNEELQISHLDELIKSKNPFSDDLRKALPDIIAQMKDRFYAINTKKYDEFDKHIKLNGGPRVIYLGLGADPNTAHVAFIGEEYINSTTTLIGLSEMAAQAHGVTTAITIGTDIFKSSNLERIVLVAKGRSKQASLEAGFSDPDTGLGYLVQNHSDKLKIFVDSELALVVDS